MVYFGSGAFAVPALERLHREGYPLLAVVSQPPKPAGRGMQLHKTPVHTLAEMLGLPVLTPARARDPEFIEQIRALAPDLIVLASYGKILPPSLLAIAPQGNWNLHASLLPKYRGAAPIQYAILNGERETGVTLMEMVAEMDAGDIYMQIVEPISPEDDAGTLEARLAQRAAELLMDGLQRLQAGTLTRTPQNHAEATYAPLLKKEDAHLRWHEPVERCWNRVRAFSPKPGAYTFWRGKLLKVWKADAVHAPLPTDGVPGVILSTAPDNFLVACGEGALRLLEVQPENRARMDVRAFVNGYRPQVGERLE
ncbi:MAG: methionyl-tRNA formyltransferase [Fimbriimonadales bacterium]|nr:methionyl-tRNA formyltransferase [Fimbriimonadales bacterium]